MNKRPIVFLWENFGPYHVDRVEAVIDRVGDSRKVVGFELVARSPEYDWDASSSPRFEKHTVRAYGEPLNAWRDFWALLGFTFRVGRGEYFLCHYDMPAIFLLAWWLRLSGSRAYTMFESKFDDRPRRVGIEFMKAVAFWPYAGVLYGGTRTRDYLRFLGLPETRLQPGYDTISVTRTRKLAAAEIAPAGVPYHQRKLVSVARLLPKKNLHTLLRSYALYRETDPAPRALHVLGSGPLEAELRALADTLGVTESVIFAGFVQSDAVARTLASALALLLPSIEEQFGLVVIEAQALGLPVIVSDNVGARDELVQSQVNGYVLEPANIEGIAAAMTDIATDERLWQQMSRRSQDFVALGDTPRFAEGVLALMATAEGGGR
ncbi:MAG: glycosyltransferase [Devosia sp.]